MTGYEQTLLARAEVLEDPGELVQSITAVLAGVRTPALTRPRSPACRTRSARSTPAPAPGTTQAARRTGSPAADTAPMASSSRRRPRPRATSWSGCGKWRSCRSRSPPRWTRRRPLSMPPTRCRSRTSATAAMASRRPRSPSAGPHRAVRDRGRDPGSPRRAPPGRAGTAPAGPPGPRRGLRAGVRVHSQGRQAARLRPVDRRGKGAHLNAGVHD